MRFPDDPAASCKVPRTFEVEHKLKTSPEEFQALLAFRKQHTIRTSDRCFIEGDDILFEEWNPETQDYSGNELLCKVTYVEHCDFGVDSPDFPSNIVVLSVKIEKWALPNEDAMTD